MLNEELRLSNIKNDKDIKTLSKAQFPGPHCPLFGAIMTASYIEDLVLLVIGTEECTYYGKDFAMMRQQGNDNMYSAVLEQDDITFGCEEELKEILLKIDREDKPNAIMVITTCVVELVGEDVSSILYSMRNKLEAKLLVVKTEHYKCNSHIEGMERAYSQLALLMNDGKVKKDTVNILGFKYEGIENTELYKILKDNNINIGMTIPTKLTIEKIQEATNACLNIVVDSTAIGLAKEMKEKFDVEYIVFKNGLDFQHIVESYKKIGKILNINIKDIIEKKYKEAIQKVNDLKKKLMGKSFIYGNTPFDSFRFTEFLVELGMTPKVVQVREYSSIYDEIRERLLNKNINPYITRMANIAPLRRLYGELKPDYYFGHESPMVLGKHGIKQIVMDNASKRIGFEKTLYALDAIIEEKNMFTMMANKNSEVDKDIKEKIKNLKNMPKEMKDTLLNMKNIPEQMAKKLMSLNENDDMMQMMSRHPNKMGMGR